MNSLYALVVGIDTYRSASPLRGCRNDASEALAFLRTRTAGVSRLSAVELYDDKATRDALIDGFRRHLRQAGPGDTALFWFAGHGSQAPVPDELWHLEPGGMAQTLVCADSRHDGCPDLLDKELSVLLDQVADGGCHVVVVLDSCHSAGATRAADPVPGALIRTVPPATEAPRLETLLPELRAGWQALPARPRHVLLAACRSSQVAHELPTDTGARPGNQRGVFSWALLRALARLGPSATYRELLAAARCAVEDRVAHQVPQLSPVTLGTGPSAVDQPFLGGGIRPPSAGMVMRHVNGGWEIDAGTCHGLPAPSTDAAGGGALTVAVAGARPIQPVRVSTVLTDRSVVEPVGWAPDPERQYPVVLTGVPQPRTTALVGQPGDEQTTVRRVVAALTGDGPALFVRRVDPGDHEVPDLVVRAPAAGHVRILDVTGTPLTADITDNDPVRCAERAATALAHIARWRQVKALANPLSGLAGAVRVEIVEARRGERTAPLDRPGLVAGEDGLIRLRYRPSDHGWTPPTVFVRLHNRGDRPLYCVLLDLTDQYRIHAGLFPGDYIGAGRRGAALDGRPVQLSLPAGTVPAPGRSVRDWFHLIVAEEEFSARPFELARLWSEPVGSARGPKGLGGILDRLGLIAVHRDAGAADPDGVYDWATATVPVLTEVPEERRGVGR